MRPLASRMSRLGTETAFEVLAKARALEAKGRDIVHLEIGEPDFDTPPSIVAAGVAALERGETHYTPSAGIVELREAIAAYIGRRRGLRVDPAQVIVTPGAKPILVYEIYAELIYDGSHRSIAVEEGMAERTILLDGFSKTFAMTGWRLGYGVFPRPLVEPVTKLVTNSVSCTATFVQRAGAAALSAWPVEVERMRAAFRERRDAVVRGLNAIPGISCRMPHGAFYVFPNVSGLGLGTSAPVADRILDEAGVAVLAGTCFGRGGEGYLRLSYANSLPNLAKAVERIGGWVQNAAALPSAKRG